MTVEIANIIKGLLGKIKKEKPTTRFPRLSWWQEKILKHQEDRQLKKINFGTLSLHYQRPYEVLHTYKELFEDEIYNFKTTKENPFIIDCGANIGLSVLYFKGLHPKATVLAFEPDAANFKLLQKNITANGLKDVTAMQSAVWTHNDTVSFSSNGSQGSQISNENKNSVTVKASRLADFLNQKQVDFLKIDIEGAEWEVLKDCAPYLHHVQDLFVEYHGKVDEAEKLAGLLDLLKNKFQIYIKPAADNLSHPFVEKQTGGAFDVQLNIFCYR